MVTSTVVQASNGSTPQPLLAEEMGCTGMSSSQALQHQVHDESRETRHEAVAGDTRDDAVRDSSNGARGNADQAPPAGANELFSELHEHELFSEEPVPCAGPIQRRREPQCLRFTRHGMRFTRQKR
jgi:hypothetical protein